MTTEASETLVDVQGLQRYFPIRRGILRREVGAIRAVDDVSIEIKKGETLGLVGESGSGKSTIGRLMLALDTPSNGRVLFRGKNLATLSAEELRLTRQQMQIIFQDPYASLNPRMRVGTIIREPLDIHGIGAKQDRDAKVGKLLAMVGLHASHAKRFPHEFSGGQRQRIGIARALATTPSFIVADEPISALDVSIQAQIVNLLAELREQLQLTYLFIAHDLSMVRHLCTRVAVMYLGKIVEFGGCEDVFSNALHPYTRALIDAIPIPDPVVARPPVLLRGEIPDPSAPPAGCSFHTRCPLATDLCRREEPGLNTARSGGAARQVACHYAETFRQSSADVGVDQ
jgi:oligopeptide/dipeptide ABC transporter ATP-binding protein